MADRQNEIGKSEVPSAGNGVIVRAKNGDLIRYDSSGLVMRLSDKVIADIAMRLNLEEGRGAGHVVVGPAAPADRVDVDEHLEGIDAWDARLEGEWIHFSANMPGRQGTRGYRRLAEGGAVIADAAGPVYGVLGIGGPRAALALQRGSDFPQHVLAPADDIGAVGHAGDEPMEQLDKLEPLRELTHEALVAETLLTWQLEKYEPLRLFVTRVETDSAADIAALVDGPAVKNLVVAAQNLALAAKRLGKPARLLCVSLDYALDDCTSSAIQYRDGMLALMSKLEAELFALGFENPIFVARLESGTAELTEEAVLAGQWELAWNHGDHRFLFSAPNYMFALNAFDRPTDEAMIESAEMTAAAVADPENWMCPTYYLAEQLPKTPNLVRVVARAKGKLVLDKSDPFDAGRALGFRCLGLENHAEIVDVKIDPEDPFSILVEFSIPPEGKDLRLAYAYGAEPRDSAFPANCGAVRDDWALESTNGRLLHRWALPAVLPITKGSAS